MYKAPRGTQDILPEEQSFWRFIEEKAQEVCSRYGYERIDTPAFENAQLFIRSVGEGTDIVEKETYTFTDRGGNEQTLRPEGTAPVCRAYLERGMSNRVKPVKLFYITPIFRYDRPQAGRYRQHHQFGCEAIGEQSPVLDAEMISLAWEFFISLGLEEINLHINSIGCKKCRADYINVLKEYYTSAEQEICPDCRRRYKENTLRLLDCKQPSCQRFTDKAPKSSEYLCEECSNHFGELKRLLESMGIPYNVNHKMVRGLDYYTKTVFELQPVKDGAQSTICGGGRYDDLIQVIGGPSTPALGFAAGIERIILNMEEQGITAPPLPAPNIFVAYVGEEAKSKAIRIVQCLRAKGARILQTTTDKSLKAQMRQANNLGIRYFVIIGEEELKKGKAVLRNMETKEQEFLPLDEIEAHLLDLSD